MKKMFKKSIACLVAVLMIASSLPFTALTAQAATQTATVSSYNVFKGDVSSSDSGNKRLDGSTLKICNNYDMNNFTIGFVNFNISNINVSNSEKVTANWAFDIGMADGCTANMGLSVFYPTANTDDFANYTANNDGNNSSYSTKGSYLGSVSTTSFNAIYTANQTDFISKAKTNYGFKQIATFTSSEIPSYPTTSTKSIDIGSAIKYAKLAGKDTATVCFMLNNHGESYISNKNCAWTDTNVTLRSDNQSFSVTTSQMSTSEVQDLVDSVIGNAQVKIPAETYNNVDTASSNTEFMKGVVYAGGWTSNGVTALNSSNNSSLSFSMGMNGLSNAVAIYDGTNADNIRFPVIAFMRGNGKSNNAYIRSISLTSSNFALGLDWYRCGGESNLTQVSNDPQNFSKEYDGTHLTNNCFYTSESKQWRNYIKYTGTGNTSTYYEQLPTQFNFYGQYGCSSNCSGGYSERKTLTLNHGMYVLNMKPYKNIVDSLKSDYSNVKISNWMYTDESLTAYYNAVIDIVNFDISKYVKTISGESSVQTAANAIKSVVEEYNSAKAGLAKKSLTVTFHRLNGSDETKTIVAGEQIGNLPTNSPVKHIDNTQKHNVYTWENTVSASTIPVSNVTYNEVATEQDCTVSAGGTCSICKEQLLDLTAYDDAYTEMGTITVNSFEYESTSHAKYLELAKAAIAIKENATTQKEVDEATAKILAAKSVLRKSSCKITVKKVIGDTESDVETITKSYGDVYDVNIVELTNNAVKGVEKWTITTDDGKTITKLNTLDTSVTLYVTKDVTITAYASDEANDDTSSKVVFLGKNGRVIAVKYLAANGSLSTNTVDIPSIPFYDQSKWDTDSVTADGSGKTIYVRAVYSCTTTNDMCTVHFGDWTKDYSYDSYVRPEGIDPTKQYALAKDAEGKNILTYLDGVDFYAPKTSDIYVVEVSSREAKIAITGSFSQRITEGGKEKRAATFNCKFYLTEDCTLVEWGAEISANGRTQVVKGESISSGNEYSITMKTTLPASSLTSFTGVAYVTYKIGNQTVTIKSDSVEQVLVD